MSQQLNISEASDESQLVKKIDDLVSFVPLFDEKFNK